MSGADRAAEPGFALVFNVGSRRSGTYWLQRIVSAHPDVAGVPSETHLYSHGLAPLFERFQHEDRADETVGQTYIERERLIAAARELALASFAQQRRGGEPFVAERTPFHVRHLPLIAEIHPEARFVHIIRDGRDATRSLMQHDWGPSSITEAATEWRDSVAAGRAAGLAEDRYREVRYEDLRDRPEAGISELFAWLGLDTGPGPIGAALAAADERRNSAPGSGGEISSGRWRQEWDDAELAEFDRVAGALQAELGYEDEAVGRAADATTPAGRKARGREAEDGSAGTMASFWDARAEENPYWFINNTLYYRGPDRAEFWASGARDVDHLLGSLAVAIDPEDDLVEIGCGIGRMTRTLASRARSVRALDVSAAMLERARAENAGLAGVSWLLGDGSSLTQIESASTDGCVSYVVFHHLPEPDLVLGYVEEMGRVLRPGGWAAFQVSTDPAAHRGPPRPRLRERLARLAGRAPGGQRHPAWLGSPIEIDRLAAAAAAAGLEIERTVGEGTQFCLVLARKRTP